MDCEPTMSDRQRELCPFGVVRVRHLVWGLVREIPKETARNKTTETT